MLSYHPTYKGYNNYSIMTAIQIAKETICSSLLYRVSAYEKMMRDTEDINELKNYIRPRIKFYCD